jgi:hypothetical protein
VDLRQPDQGTPGSDEARRHELDARVEALAQQIVDVVNEADPVLRHDLREYATDLVRGGTETADLPLPAPRSATAPSTNPIGLALLLGALSVPMLLIFVPLGLMMAVVAVVLGAVGIGMTVLRR